VRRKNLKDLKRWEKGRLWETILSDLCQERRDGTILTMTDATQSSTTTTMSPSIKREEVPSERLSTLISIKMPKLRKWEEGLQDNSRMTSGEKGDIQMLSHIRGEVEGATLVTETSTSEDLVQDSNLETSILEMTDLSKTPTDRCLIRASTTEMTDLDSSLETEISELTSSEISLSKSRPPTSKMMKSRTRGFKPKGTDWTERSGTSEIDLKLNSESLQDFRVDKEQARKILSFKKYASIRPHCLF
jgi:hypothetical protein